MKLTEENIKLRKLEASENKVIQSKINIEIQGKVIYLGKEDSEENYIEIDEIIEEGK